MTQAKAQDDSTEPAGPIQLILFGSPGTGKSYRVENVIAKSLNSPTIFKTVFHPEYTYGDFMGKLLPYTNESGKVTYRYYPGHFMRALAVALMLHYEQPDAPQDVLLVIDEINRGNSAAIFGAVFQLLDRDADGWSSYHVDVSDMEKLALLKEMGAVQETHISGGKKTESWTLGAKDLTEYPANQRVKLPPNFNIVCTMNTSDESIYYMDSAFKRRWSWEYVEANDGLDEELAAVTIEGTDKKWTAFVDKLNEFITSHHDLIRKVEDKQIGYYFIKAKQKTIPKSEIQNKLMFFLWDTVFSRSRSTLAALLQVNGADLVTFGDFSAKADELISKISVFKSE